MSGSWSGARRHKAVYSLLPFDGSEMKYSDLLRKAKPKGISSRTLTKYATRFTKIGAWLRKERYRGKLKEVFYSVNPSASYEAILRERARLQVPRGPSVKEAVKRRLLEGLESKDTVDWDRWTSRESRIANQLLVRLSMSAYAMGKLIDEACKRPNLSIAKSYLDFAIETQLRDSLQFTLEKCYPFKDARHNAGSKKEPNILPISSLVAETFLCQAQDAGFKWEKGVEEWREYKGRETAQ